MGGQFGIIVERTRKQQKHWPKNNTKQHSGGLTAIWNKKSSDLSTIESAISPKKTLNPFSHGIGEFEFECLPQLSGVSLSEVQKWKCFKSRLNFGCWLDWIGCSLVWDDVHKYFVLTAQLMFDKKGSHI